jgi:hypothetical protein
LARIPNRHIFLVTVLLSSILLAAAAEAKPVNTLHLMLKPGIKCTLQKPSDGFEIKKQYQGDDLWIELVLIAKENGIILDSAGSNPQQAGVFRLAINGDGHLGFGVYAPDAASSTKGEEGWHWIVSPDMLSPSLAYIVTVLSGPDEISLWIDHTLVGKMSIPVIPRGQVYIGNFPGDDEWDSIRNKFPGMAGTLVLNYFGSIDPKAYAAQRMLIGSEEL